MITVKILAFVLTAALFVVAAIALYIGGMGVTGAIQLARCTNCGHTTVVAPHEGAGSCPFCRHERILHPVHTLHVFGTHALRH